MFKDEILNSIKELAKGEKTFLVGGYLRNYFLNNTISYDRDLVVEKNSYALAEKIAKKLDGTLVELDNINKIYRVCLKDKKNYFDVSEALENNIEKDAKRRDFTINSIFYDLNEEKIYDPFNGINDIKNKIIKTVNLQNMLDDELRFLRIYRFMSLTGFKIDETLTDFSKKNFHLVKNVAPERINYEIIKIFEGEYLTQTLLKMLDDGALEIIFPFVKEIKRIPSNSHHHLDLIHHSIETVNLIETSNPILKIAAFYHDIGKPRTWTIEPVGRHRFIGHDIKGAEIVKKELKTLKFSNKQIEYISKMIKNHIYPASLINASKENNKAFAKCVKKLGVDFLDVIKLSRADRLAAQGEAITPDILEKSLKHLDELENYYHSVQNIIENPKPLLNGKEIMEILNIKPSKQVGKIMDELVEMQLTGEIKDKTEAVEYVKKRGLI